MAQILRPVRGTYGAPNCQLYYGANGHEYANNTETVCGNDATMAFYLENARKYMLSTQGKSEIEDLRKASWFLNSYLEIYDKSAPEEN